MEYGAIDLHLRHSQIRIVREDGSVVADRRISTSREALTALFGDRAPMRVVVETGTDSEWVAQTVEACGHEVVVVDPNYALMYGTWQRRVKTDRRDAAGLAGGNRRGGFCGAHRVSSPHRRPRRGCARGGAPNSGALPRCGGGERILWPRAARGQLGGASAPRPHHQDGAVDAAQFVNPSGVGRVAPARPRSVAGVGAPARRATGPPHCGRRVGAAAV